MKSISFYICLLKLLFYLEAETRRSPYMLHLLLGSVQQKKPLSTPSAKSENFLLGQNTEVQPLPMEVWERFSSVDLSRKDYREDIFFPMIRTVGKSKNREKKKKNQFSQWFLKNARKSEEKKKNRRFSRQFP